MSRPAATLPFEAVTCGGVEPPKKCVKATQRPATIIATALPILLIVRRFASFFRKAHTRAARPGFDTGLGLVMVKISPAFRRLHKRKPAHCDMHASHVFLTNTPSSLRT